MASRSRQYKPTGCERPEWKDLLDECQRLLSVETLPKPPVGLPPQGGYILHQHTYRDGSQARYTLYYQPKPVDYRVHQGGRVCIGSFVDTRIRKYVKKKRLPPGHYPIGAIMGDGAMRILIGAEDVRGEHIPAPIRLPAHVLLLSDAVEIRAHPLQDKHHVILPWGAMPRHYGRIRIRGVALKGHNGLDLATDPGHPVVAVDAGIVMEIGDDAGGYGIYVRLRHSWGESLYAHLARTHLVLGAYVGAGKDVGIAGRPHLHFAIRKLPYRRDDGWGGYSDPEPYLRGTHAPCNS